MSVSFELNATVRSDLGKGASRRLRRSEKVPAVLYGAEEAPVSLTFEHDALLHALENEAFYSHILTINVDGVANKAILKDVQRHPFKPKIVHIDLLRVDEQHQIHTQAPLHFINEDKAAGVKKGGSVTHLVTEVEITCFPSQLPEFIEVDVLNLEVGQTLHLSDLNLSEGVTLVELTKGSEHDLPVVTIQSKGGAQDQDEAESAE